MRCVHNRNSQFIHDSVRDFINEAAKNLDIKIDWRGKNLNEIGSCNGEDIIKIDPRYFRPTEVDTLLGDSSKAKDKLNAPCRKRKSS